MKRKKKLIPDHVRRKRGFRKRRSQDTVNGGEQSRGLSRLSAINHQILKVTVMQDAARIVKMDPVIYDPAQDVMQHQRRQGGLRVKPFGLHFTLDPVPETKALSKERREVHWRMNRKEKEVHWYFLKGDMHSECSVCLLFTNEEAQFREKIGTTFIFSMVYPSKDAAMQAFKNETITWSGGVRTESKE